MHCTLQYTIDTKNILSNYVILHMFGAFVVKKWHFPPESPEFRPKFPEFRFLNLNSPSFRKMRFSTEFRPEFCFRWSSGFVKKTKMWTWCRVAVGVIEIGRFVPFWLRFLLGLGYRALLACPVLWSPVVSEAQSALSSSAPAGSSWPLSYCKSAPRPPPSPLV